MDSFFKLAFENWYAAFLLGNFPALLIWVGSGDWVSANVDERYEGHFQVWPWNLLLDLPYSLSSVHVFENGGLEMVESQVEET